MTPPSPYNSQGWRGRQQRAAMRKAHQDSLNEIRTQRARLYEAQAAALNHTAPESPAEAPVAPVEPEGPTVEPNVSVATDEAAVAPEVDSIVEPDTDAVAAAPKGRKKG